ncbi:MAG: energy coupling factor transporter S component ThiW [Lachnospira sp.]|nr:energy coupling factor transporter S component ThiW [Lachnospira sp.]
MNDRNTVTIRKMVLTAMLGCLAFVLSTFVYFPQMAPFQHFVDVIAAVLLGPWYACAAAFLAGILRMMTGRTIQAVVGAIFGPILGGLLYRRFHNVFLTAIGEVLGTGFIGGSVAYPLMTKFYGVTQPNWWFYIPFYIPSAAMGAAMGVMVVLILKKTGVLARMQAALTTGRPETAAARNQAGGKR